MLKKFLSVTRRRFCLHQAKPYSIGSHEELSGFPETSLASSRGGILMTWLTQTWRRILAGLLLVVACSPPAAAQDQRRGFSAPPAAAAIHAVTAEHGMVVAQ